MSIKKTVNLLENGGAFAVSCRISRGQLLPALLPAVLDGLVPTGASAAFYSRSQGKFFLCTDTRIYTSSDGAHFVQSKNIYGGIPFLIEDIDGGEARAVLISGEWATEFKGGVESEFLYGANLSCGVMHCGRLFGADGEDGLVIRWSGEGGLCDRERKINGSGSVKLDPERGAVLDILEYGEKLVAVRKFGLTVMSMFGQPENFSVGLTNTDCAEIYKGTAKVVGGKLLFATSAGLRSFDGDCIKEVEHDYEGDISNPTCAVAFGGKYYLGCYSKKLNGGAILCCGAEDGSSYLIDFAANGLCAADGVYAYNASGAHRLESGGQYSFTKSFDFGSDGQKTVTKISVFGSGVNLEISNGRISRKFSNVSGRVNPRLRGRSFTVTVAGDKPVYGLTATAEVMNEL